MLFRSPNQGATARPVLPCNAGKTGGFSSPIRANKGHTFPRSDIKAQAINGFDAAKVFDEIVYLQHQFDPAVETSRPDLRGRLINDNKPEGEATMMSMMKTPSKPRQ